MPKKKEPFQEQGYTPGSETGLVREKKLLDLFPPISPYSTGFLDVDGEHSLYWEQSGNPDGIPVLLLHGGPGEGSSPVHRQFFDPDHYRIIIYDQRGAGRSKPLGSIENNTMDDLLQDIERIRLRFNIDKFHIFGGSWGSTLAIAYAQKYPEHCLSLILRSVFLMEEKEINWFLYGMKMIFPEAWEQFADFFAEDCRDNLLDCYYDALIKETDKSKQIEAAIRWVLYEGACASLIPNYETITSDEQKEYALSMARLECFYFKHQIIPPEKSLIDRVQKLKSIPTTIIHGRYDIISPIHTAHTLHMAWPEAEFIIVPDGGHSALDPAIRSCLIEATEAAKSIKIY